MFNFKLSPLWLFGIIIIVLVVSMLWYNNSSIEGFGSKPTASTAAKLIEYYPDAANSLYDFGLEFNNKKNYFDSNTGNIVRDYNQTITVIDRAGNKRKFVKDDIESEILVENDEIHKGSTYGAFSLYEEDDDEQLFYISVGTTTFIHSIVLSDNKHGPTCVFDTLDKQQTDSQNISGLEIATTLPSFSLNSANLDISGIIVNNAMDFTGGIYYDPSAQLMILKTTNPGGTDNGTGPMLSTAAGDATEAGEATAAEAAITAATVARTAATAAEAAIDGTDATELESAVTNAAAALTTAATALTAAGEPTAAEEATAAAETITAETNLQTALTDAASALRAAADVLDPPTQGFTLFNNRFTKEELEGFTTTAGSDGNAYTWDIYNRLGNKIMETDFNSGEYAPSTTNPSNPKAQIFKTGDGKMQVLMISYMEETVILALANEGKNGNNKYKLLGIRRYIGKNLEQPTTASAPNYTPGEQEENNDEDDDEDDETDMSDSAMSEYWKWFHYWNADGGSGYGGSQPMSQDYMLKTDYVPLKCPSCNGNDNKCKNCNKDDGKGHGHGHGHGHRHNGGSGGGNSNDKGSAGVANNLIDKTSGLLEKSIDTGADIGRDVASSAANLGRDTASGAANLGRDAASGAVNLGRDAASGLKSATTGAVDLGREVVSGTLELGKDLAEETSDFILDTQYANAGGYASGSNGDLRTRKYVRGGNQPGGMDPYTYNGLLSKRGGSNYIPITSDFSSFR